MSDDKEKETFQSDFASTCKRPSSWDNSDDDFPLPGTLQKTYDETINLCETLIKEGSTEPSINNITFFLPMENETKSETKDDLISLSKYVESWSEKSDTDKVEKIDRRQSPARIRRRTKSSSSSSPISETDNQSSYSDKFEKVSDIINTNIKVQQTICSPPDLLDFNCAASNYDDSEIKGVLKSNLLNLVIEKEDSLKNFTNILDMQPEYQKTNELQEKEKTDDAELEIKHNITEENDSYFCRTSRKLSKILEVEEVRRDLNEIESKEAEEGVRNCNQKISKSSLVTDSFHNGLGCPTYEDVAYDFKTPRSNRSNTAFDFFSNKLDSVNKVNKNHLEKGFVHVKGSISERYYPLLHYLEEDDAICLTPKSARTQMKFPEDTGSWSRSRNSSKHLHDFKSNSEFVENFTKKVKKDVSRDSLLINLKLSLSEESSPRVTTDGSHQSKSEERELNQRLDSEFIQKGKPNFIVNLDANKDLKMSLSDRYSKEKSFENTVKKQWSDNAILEYGAQKKLKKTLNTSQRHRDPSVFVKSPSFRLKANLESDKSNRSNTSCKKKLLINEKNIMIENQEDIKNDFLVSPKAFDSPSEETLMSPQDCKKEGKDFELHYINSISPRKNSYQLFSSRSLGMQPNTYEKTSYSDYEGIRKPKNSVSMPKVLDKFLNNVNKSSHKSVSFDKSDKNLNFESILHFDIKSNRSSRSSITKLEELDYTNILQKNDFSEVCLVEEKEQKQLSPVPLCEKLSPQKSDDSLISLKTSGRNNCNEMELQRFEFLKWEELKSQLISPPSVSGSSKSKSNKSTPRPGNIIEKSEKNLLNANPTVINQASQFRNDEDSEMELKIVNTDEKTNTSNINISETFLETSCEARQYSLDEIHNLEEKLLKKPQDIHSQKLEGAPKNFLLKHRSHTDVKHECNEVKKESKHLRKHLTYSFSISESSWKHGESFHALKTKQSRSLQASPTKTKEVNESVSDILVNLKDQRKSKIKQDNTLWKNLIEAFDDTKDNTKHSSFYLTTPEPKSHFYSSDVDNVLSFSSGIVEVKGNNQLFENEEDKNLSNGNDNPQNSSTLNDTHNIKDIQLINSPNFGTLPSEKVYENVIEISCFGSKARENTVIGECGDVTCNDIDDLEKKPLEKTRNHGGGDREGNREDTWSNITFPTEKENKEAKIQRHLWTEVRTESVKKSLNNIHFNANKTENLEHSKPSKSETLLHISRNDIHEKEITEERKGKKEIMFPEKHTDKLNENAPPFERHLSHNSGKYNNSSKLESNTDTKILESVSVPMCSGSDSVFVEEHYEIDDYEDNSNEDIFKSTSSISERDTTDLNIFLASVTNKIKPMENNWLMLRSRKINKKMKKPKRELTLGRISRNYGGAGNASSVSFLKLRKKKCFQCFYKRLISIFCVTSPPTSSK